MRGFPNNGVGAPAQELRARVLGQGLWARALGQALWVRVLGRGFRVKVLGTKVYGSVVLDN